MGTQFKPNQDDLKENEDKLLKSINEINNKMENLIYDTSFTVYRLEKPDKILQLHNLRNRLIFETLKSKSMTKSFEKFLNENNLIDFKLQNLWNEKETEKMCCVLCYESVCPCSLKNFPKKCENCDCNGCKSIILGK